MSNSGVAIQHFIAKHTPTPISRFSSAARCFPCQPLSVLGEQPSSPGPLLQGPVLHPEVCAQAQEASLQDREQIQFCTHCDARRA